MPPGLRAPSCAALHEGWRMRGPCIAQPQASNTTACVPAWSGGSHRPFCIYFKVPDFVAFFFFF